jgi:uncharacterized protein
MTRTKSAKDTTYDLNMKKLRSLIWLLCIAAVAQSLPAQSPASAEKPKQFIYVLHLVPRLYDDKAWTTADTAAVDRHLANFKAAVQSGQLILAGRTRESGDKTFGIAIFEAADEAAAQKFMETDPAVAAGVMTAELHPFSVVLQRKNP